jgi:hypothetical protein
VKKLYGDLMVLRDTRTTLGERFVSYINLIKEIELSRGSNTGNDWEIQITYGNNKLNIFNSSSRASDKPDR